MKKGEARDMPMVSTTADRGLVRGTKDQFGTQVCDRCLSASEESSQFCRRVRRFSYRMRARVAFMNTTPSARP
jgi:hypothetical protein